MISSSPDSSGTSDCPILAAGEIGAYTVCPQAWVLRTVQRVQAQRKPEQVTEGQALHRAWAEGHDEVLGLARAVRVALLLLAFAALLLVWLSIR